jgi:hypothetical protein
MIDFFRRIKHDLFIPDNGLGHILWFEIVTTIAEAGASAYIDRMCRSAWT